MRFYWLGVATVAILATLFALIVELTAFTNPVVTAFALLIVVGALVHIAEPLIKKYF